MKIYVGNLSYEVTEDDLRQALEQFGKVESASIIIDKLSGQSKGFGFVEMISKTEAEAAINGLNGQELKGRELSVNEARPRPDSPVGKGSFGNSRGVQGGNRKSYGGGNSDFGGNRGGQGGNRGGMQNDNRGRQGGGRGGQGRGR